jgi:phosphoglycolate phosphatase
MMAKRHAIFDLDGTLADSLPGIAWSIREALAACGLPPFSMELRPLIGPPIRSILATVSGLRDAASLDRLEQAFRASYDAGGWRRTLCYEGAPELLEDLFSAGIGLWLVTNKPARATGKILRELMLNGYFAETVSRDSRLPAYGSKGEALTDLLGRRGLRPGDCVMVGDTEEDRRAAEEAGVASVIVPHGYGAGRAGERPEWRAVRARFGVAIEREFEQVGSL